MIVQERANGKRKTSVVSSEELKSLNADSEDELEKDVEQLESSKTKKTRSWDSFFSCSAYGDNMLKLTIVLFFLSSVVVFLFYRTHGETAAILCIQEVAKDLEAIPVPVVNLEHIHPAKDYTRYAGVSADKWIVTAVSGSPTEEVKLLANVKGWQVLAVGMDDTPQDWRVANVIFLSMDQQSELGYRINEFLPRNSYIRKNIGYLFAIQHGARKIYDADESASLLKGDLADVFDVELTGAGSNRGPILQYRYFDYRKVVNPFVHFGQCSVWPRGLPLESISDIPLEVTYAEVTRGKQYIQQSLANGLPDVDSLFYFTRKSQAAPLDIQFDSFAPPVLLPQGYMAPVNALNTLFHSSAFWSLLLPVSVAMKTSDIMRGYWGQRLLWEVGGVLGVYPPLVSRKDTLQGPPFEDEKDLHAKALRLVSFLLQWRSHKSTLFQKILHLSHSLAEEEFWTGQDVKLTAAWLQDLVSVGYTQPRLMALELDRNRTSWSELGHKTFVPHPFAAPYLGLEDITGMANQMADLIRWRNYFGNIVLVLECVGPTNHTVLGLRMFYGRLFKHIVILGSQADEQLGVEAVNGQSYKAFAGIFDRYPNADGFLMLKDDVVLNYWNLVSANKTKFWNVHKVSGAWQTFGATDAAIEGGFQSAEVKKNFKQAFKNMPPEFRKAYRKSKGEDRYVVSPSDVYYVPQRFVTNFITLITPANKAGLPPEVAIPMIFLAIDRVENYDAIALSTMYYIDEKKLRKSGGDPSAFYKSDVDAVHPWRATTESELARLLKTIGKNDPHLLDAFD